MKLLLRIRVKQIIKWVYMEKSDNELIAEFMEGMRLKLTGPRNMWYIKSRNQTVDLGDMLYDKSWNWLMPVVEKIYRLEDGVKRLGVQVTIKNSKCTISINKKRFVCHTISPLNSTYGAVVQFLNWYNSQK